MAPATWWNLAFLSPSYSEMLLLLLVALLLYGGDLPKVARSWGKTLGEFRKGLSGLQNEFRDVMNDPPRRIPYTDPVYSEHSTGDAGQNDQGYDDDEFAASQATSETSQVVEGEATVSEVADEETAPDTTDTASSENPESKGHGAS